MAGEKMLPAYECHKIVGALKISDVRLGDSPMVAFAEEGYDPVAVTHEFLARGVPRAGDYYVVYEDGYASWSPAKVFDEGYRLVPTAVPGVGNVPA